MKRKTIVSTAHRDQARDAILGWHNRLRAQRPKCGAKRKYDGEPCQQIAMSNGRCAYHGGRTPKGSGWHKPRWPNGEAPDAEVKLRRKLKTRAKETERRSARLAAMTAEQREKHKRWQSSHTPGAARLRAERRLQRKLAVDVLTMLEKPPDSTSVQLEKIQAEIAKLQRQAAALAFDVFG